MNQSRWKRDLVLGGLAVGVLTVTAFLLVGRASEPRAPAPAEAAETHVRAAPALAPAAPARPAAAASPAASPLPPAASGAPGPLPPVINDFGDTGYPVDLAALRQKLPDNLYWKVGVPTHDPEVAKQRAADAQRWNELFGRVQSGTASEAEIRQYYDYRRQLSQDYIQFAQQVLKDYGSQLPDQDRGLYELALQMHQTRLDEIPRQMDEAFARKREQDRRREEWVRGGKP